MIVGKTAKGGTSYPLAADTKRVARVEFGAEQLVTKLTAYLDGLGVTGGGQAQAARAVIYNEAGVLVAQGSEVLIPSAAPVGWYDFPFDPATAGARVTAGLYDLGLIVGGLTDLIRIKGDASSARGGKWNADTYGDGAAAAFGAPTVVASDLSIFATGAAIWEPSEDETDFYYSRLPMAEAQAELGEETPAPNPLYLAQVGWHHTRLDPEWGTFAIVNDEGPLIGLLGERVKVTVRAGTVERSVICYVHNYGELDEDISLTRRCFFELGLLSEDSLEATVEVLV